MNLEKNGEPKTRGHFFCVTQYPRIISVGLLDKLEITWKKWWTIAFLNTQYPRTISVGLLDKRKLGKNGVILLQAHITVVFAVFEKAWQMEGRTDGRTLLWRCEDASKNPQRPLTAARRKKRSDLWRYCLKPHSQMSRRSSPGPTDGHTFLYRCDDASKKPSRRLSRRREEKEVRLVTLLIKSHSQDDTGNFT